MKGWIEGKVYYKKELEKDRLRMGGGAWSINIDQLKDRELEKVVYITSEARYEIGWKKAKEKGFIRILGEETKLVVPIRNWEVKK